MVLAHSWRADVHRHTRTLAVVHVLLSRIKDTFLPLQPRACAKLHRSRLPADVAIDAADSARSIFVYACLAGPLR